jgi:hypothetical protein
MTITLQFDEAAAKEMQALSEKTGLGPVDNIRQALVCFSTAIELERAGRRFVAITRDGRHEPMTFRPVGKVKV